MGDLFGEGFVPRAVGERASRRLINSKDRLNDIVNDSKERTNRRQRYLEKLREADDRRFSAGRFMYNAAQAASLGTADDIVAGAAAAALGPIGWKRRYDNISEKFNEYQEGSSNFESIAGSVLGALTPGGVPMRLATAVGKAFPGRVGPVGGGIRTIGQGVVGGAEGALYSVAEGARTNKDIGVGAGLGALGGAGGQALLGEAAPYVMRTLKGSTDKQAISDAITEPGIDAADSAQNLLGKIESSDEVDLLNLPYDTATQAGRNQEIKSLQNLSDAVIEGDIVLPDLRARSPKRPKIYGDEEAAALAVENIVKAQNQTIETAKRNISSVAGPPEDSAQRIAAMNNRLGNVRTAYDNMFGLGPNQSGSKSIPGKEFNDRLDRMLLDITGAQNVADIQDPDLQSMANAVRHAVRGNVQLPNSRLVVMQAMQRDGGDIDPELLGEATLSGIHKARMMIAKQAEPGVIDGTSYTKKDPKVRSANKLKEQLDGLLDELTNGAYSVNRDAFARIASYNEHIELGREAARTRSTEVPEIGQNIVTWLKAKGEGAADRELKDAFLKGYRSQIGEEMLGQKGARQVATEIFDNIDDPIDQGSEFSKVIKAIYSPKELDKINSVTKYLVPKYSELRRLEEAVRARQAKPTESPEGLRGNDEIILTDPILGQNSISFLSTAARGARGRFFNQPSEMSGRLFYDAINNDEGLGKDTLEEILRVGKMNAAIPRVGQTVGFGSVAPLISSAVGDSSEDRDSASDEIIRYLTGR